MRLLETICTRPVASRRDPGISSSLKLRLPRHTVAQPRSCLLSSKHAVQLQDIAQFMRRPKFELWNNPGFTCTSYISYSDIQTPELADLLLLWVDQQSFCFPAVPMLSVDSTMSSPLERNECLHRSGIKSSCLGIHPPSAQATDKQPHSSPHRPPYVSRFSRICLLLSGREVGTRLFSASPSPFFSYVKLSDKITPPRALPEHSQR